MKHFANIQEALDFATINQHRLKFPFICKCNGLPVKVLSPELARTLSQERPNLIATRKPSAALELSYVLSLRALRDILRSMATAEIHYSLSLNGDKAAVVRTTPAATSHFTFPIVKRTPRVAEDEGTFILLEASSQSQDWKSFWVPLEMRLLHSAMQPVA